MFYCSWRRHSLHCEVNTSLSLHHSVSKPDLTFVILVSFVINLAKYWLLTMAFDNHEVGSSFFKRIICFKHSSLQIRFENRFEFAIRTWPSSLLEELQERSSDCSKRSKRPFWWESGWSEMTVVVTTVVISRVHRRGSIENVGKTGVSDEDEETWGGGNDRVSKIDFSQNRGKWNTSEWLPRTKRESYCVLSIDEQRTRSGSHVAKDEKRTFLVRIFFFSFLTMSCRCCRNLRLGKWKWRESESVFFVESKRSQPEADRVSTLLWFTSVRNWQCIRMARQ